MQPLHFLTQFEPLPGNESEFRSEMNASAQATRAESGCLRLEIFESVGEPVRFAMHGVWMDEAAFNHHLTLPHAVAFVAAAGRLLSHPIQGFRSRAI